MEGIMTVLVYNTRTGRMERYERGAREAMPYADSTLLVGEFRGTSQSNLLWTTSAAMQAWVATRKAWGRPIYLPHAFRRIGENGHASQSQHYAGTAFDCAQNIGNTERARLRQLAANLGVWVYIEPVRIAPTWVHFDRRLGPPACAAGFPLLRRGIQNNYVCILQDALNTVARAGLVVDGIFGTRTLDWVEYFQSLNRIRADGIVGCVTWTKIAEQAVGAGVRDY
jgi:peptidoglycan hydrolase-like protein with peptidoglycan-binding domain